MVMKEKKLKPNGHKPQIKAMNNEVVPLNKKLYNDFSTEELEHRLETKAWGCDCNGGCLMECPSNSCNAFQII